MMRTRTWWVGLAAVIAACSGSRGSSGTSSRTSSAGVPWVTERAQGGADTEQAVARAASGAQAGVVREITKNFIVIDPYESWAGDANMQIADVTQVFRGDERIGEHASEAVKKGQDVNVYFKQEGGKPRAIGIRILSNQEASQLRQAISRRTREDADRSAREDAERSASSRSGDSWKDRQTGSDDSWKDRQTGGSTTGSASAGTLPFGAAPSQSGRIASVSGDELVLDPYARSAGDARLSMSSDVQVMRGGERLGREALREGADVRVFYEERSGDAPKVVGVELLSDDEADRLRDAGGK
jgi:hypothetical protein